METGTESLGRLSHACLLVARWSLTWADRLTQLPTSQNGVTKRGVVSPVLPESATSVRKSLCNLDRDDVS